MLSRPPADRQFLVLQNAESATAWIVFSGEMSRSQERGQDEQRCYYSGSTGNQFLSMYGQDAIFNFRSLMSPRNSIDTPYTYVRLAIQNYISPKDSVNGRKVLSVIQGVGDSNDGFLARLSEEARYCDFEKLKTAANPEEELVKIKSGLRDLQAKLRLLDGTKAKPAMSVTELTLSLLFRSQAMAFATSSSGYKPFHVKESWVHLQNDYLKTKRKIYGS